MMNRGRYSSKVSRLKYVITGAGSIGSIIAEQLVRAGINKMLIIDGDYLETGNKKETQEIKSSIVQNLYYLLL